MVEIQFKNFSKCWGSFVGVDDFNFMIVDKEFFVFLGFFGCGKIMMMCMIVGLEDVIEGDILVDGMWVNDLEFKD